jgi:hypothetical protein
MSTYTLKEGDYVLVAVGGDCGPQGITDVADVVYVDLKDEFVRTHVEDLLRAQVETTLYSALDEDPASSVRGRMAYWRQHKAGLDLTEDGVFTHKYQTRSTWMLMEWTSETPEYLCWLNSDQYEQYHGQRHYLEAQREEVSA